MRSAEPGAPASATRCSPTSARRSRRDKVAVRVEPVPVRVPWRQGRVTSWVTTTDHKRIGILYIATSLVFFLLGGILATLIRTQLLVPHNHFLTKNSYNEAVTIHGTTMIFLV